MATPIGFTYLLDKFSVVFIMIFLFAILFGLLEVISIFGKERKNLHAAIAAAITLISILTPALLTFIKTMLPWISLMIVFFFFLHAIPMFMGLKQDEVLVFMGGAKKLGAIGWVLGAMIFLVVYTLGGLYGEQHRQEIFEGNETVANINETGATFQAQVFKIIYNPKIVGLFVVLLIAMLAITYLTREAVG